MTDLVQKLSKNSIQNIKEFLFYLVKLLQNQVEFAHLVSWTRKGLYRFQLLLFAQKISYGRTEAFNVWTKFGKICHSGLHHLTLGYSSSNSSGSTSVAHSSRTYIETLR